MRLVNRGLVERSEPGNQVGGIQQERQRDRTLERPDEDNHRQPEARHGGHLRKRAGLCAVHSD